MAFTYAAKGLEAWTKSLKDYCDHAEEYFFTERAEIISKLTIRVAGLTPVWEGNTLANWRWSIGVPSLNEIEEIGQGIAPGPTNTMPLGTEPRREMNTAQVMESMAKAIIYQGFDDLYLTNPADGAIPLEYGQWPGGKGQESRSPQGMLRLTLAEIGLGIY